MKKFLTFEALLEMCIDRASNDLESRVKIQGFYKRKNEFYGYQFHEIESIPSFFTLLCLYGEQFSNERDLVELMTEDMVKINHKIKEIEIREAQLEMEKIKSFIDRQSYCGD